MIKQRGGCGLGTWHESENTEMQAMKEREQTEELRVVGRTIHLTVIGWEGVDWITVAQDKDRWRAFINTAMKFQV
jgi:hypothetical protein